ncbi:hypothetical protein BaRGS_00029147 [Batillaria attramentaria]|uniref:Uncharacterized protein n=1 Tax=Batillaria attramentaria TaxID=370345 RepID=A0ABD0JXA5_9CAEN
MRKLFSFWFLLSVIAHCLSSGDHCVSFHFPALNSSVLSVPENTNITLPFQFIDDSCLRSADNFKIVISKKDKETHHFRDFCDILHVHGTCVQPFQETSCVCLEEDGMYQFRKLADRSDSTTWVWMTSNDIAAERSVNIEATCEDLGFTDDDLWYEGLTTPRTKTSLGTEDTAHHGINLTVVISVGIVSFAATVVAVARIVSRKGSRKFSNT